MKCKLYNSIMWMACLIMASCSEQELIEQVSKPVHSNTLHVVTEKQESRSVLNYEGNFYWTENDYIGVYGSETENARFNLTSQGDGISTFTGNMNVSNEAVKWAYFPYSQEVKVNQQQLTFPISAERTISNENHSPMIGQVESDNTVRFYHTGGILYLKVVGIPEYATQLVVASEGENAPYLAGTAVIDDRYEDGCTYYIKNGSREIVYDVQSLNKDEYFHYIYVPLQVGNYEKIRVAIRNEKGGTIKERTLSDLIVERARMTETPVLNFSEKLYGYQLPEDCLVETQWDEAMLFSNELFIACDNESEETRRFFISNVMDWGSPDAKALQVVMDAEGNVLNMTTDSFSAYFSNRKGDYVDITLMLDNNIETFANQYLPSRSAQGRAGVAEGTIVSSVVGIVDACSSLKKVTDDIFSGLGKTELALQTVSALADNKAVKIVVGIVGEAMSGAVEGAVGGLIVGSVGGPAGALSGAITGAGVGAVKGLIVGTIKVVAEELDNKNNERIYEKFCGQAQIVLGEPKQINNEMFSIEYSLRNSQSVPDAYKLRGTCGLLVRELYYDVEPSISQIRYGFSDVQSYGERNLSSDWTHVQNISFKKGCAYLMVAYVTAFDVTDENVLNTLNPICYYSDVKKITFHQSSLENVTVAPNNPMAYANRNFHTTVRADVQCFAKDWKVCIMRGENTYMEQSYSGNTPQSVVFNLEIPALLYFNLTKMNGKDDVIKPDDKWRISVVAMNENGTTSSQSKDLNFVYDTPSSIKIVSAKKIATQKVSSSSSRAADDEEGTYYQTTYEITVQVKGAPRFKYFQVRSSEGILYSGNIMPHEDGTYVYEGTIVYKEDEAPDYIDIEGYAFYYGGHFDEFDASIRCTGSPIESCELK